jgi:hypothetical protein
VLSAISFKKNSLIITGFELKIIFAYYGKPGRQPF